MGSEEDIRTKVVASWLSDHGFSADEILLEKSFELRLGRNVLRVGSDQPVDIMRPRTDLLVRSVDGRNLLIVEVKAEDKSLTEEDREQAISYARLLRKGGIAPFSILTNGHQTEIYDSLTEERIEGERVPSNHRHARAGFRVTGNDIAIRAEALENFVSLSPANLLAFCKAQVDRHMRPLRSDDPYSGKKYIPALYIRREEPERELNKKLEEEQQKLILVTGEPQQGKTNFICNAVEERLTRNEPCLFYPAIGLRAGLLEELREDFEWTTESTTSAPQVVLRLNRILRATGQQLTIFVDGWNEVERIAQSIDLNQECSRLSYESIAVVLSTTNISLPRLLIDDAGNSTYVADEASLKRDQIHLLARRGKQNSDKITKNAIVEVRGYNSLESKTAFSVYQSAYNVDVSLWTQEPHSSNEIVQDSTLSNPFLLGTAMRTNAGRKLPKPLDEPTLVKESLRLRAERAGYNESADLFSLLKCIGEGVFFSGAPLEQHALQELIGLPVNRPLPAGLFDAAILTRTHDERGLPQIDFYYSRVRDYVIAFLARSWSQILLGGREEVINELSAAGSVEAVLDALRWFLSLPSNLKHLKNVIEHQKTFPNIRIKEAVLSCVRQAQVEHTDEFMDWVFRVIGWATQEPEPQIKEAAADLIVLFAESKDQSSEILSLEEQTWLRELLRGDYLYDGDIIGPSALEAIRDMHLQTLDEWGTTSAVSEFLTPLLNHRSRLVRWRAAIAMGHIAPRDLLENLKSRILAGNLAAEEKPGWVKAAETAAIALDEEYFPMMCSSGVENYLAEYPEDLYHEVEALAQTCSHIVLAFPSTELATKLRRLLTSLAPPEDKYPPLTYSPNQLDLPFFSEEHDE